MPFLDVDLFSLLTTIFWIWMLVDCVLNNRLKIGNKIIWLLVIFFTNIVGAIIYFFMACSHRNPVNAFNYYAAVLTNFFQRRNTSNQPPPVYTPKAYAPPPVIFSDYRQGYRSQPPASQPTAQENAPPAYHPQADYEQPTASYPEMPMQEQ